MERTKKLLLIGDLHGHFDTAVKALYWGKVEGYTPLFFGDLSDSFHTTKKDQLKCMLLVLDQLDSENGWCLWGNHDLSYINSALYACSGFTNTKKEYFKDAYRRLLNHPRFVPYKAFDWKEDEKLLMTHAGLAPELLPVRKDPIKFLEEELMDRAKAFNDPHPLLQAGSKSGGPNAVGGVTWLRKTETEGGFPNLIQFVGHTPQDKVNYDGKRNTYYLDTLEYSDNKELVAIDLVKKEVRAITKEDYLV